MKVESKVGRNKLLYLNFPW